MDLARERSNVRDDRFDGLHAEAKAALAYAGNTVRAVRDRYREAYREELRRWHSLRDDLDRFEGGATRAKASRNGRRPDPAETAERGPAQALTNAIFQVEYVERVLDHDAALARQELRFLHQLLRRELGDVRSFISQLRPRVLDQLGLEGSIRETVENMSALTGLDIAT